MSTDQFILLLLAFATLTPMLGGGVGAVIGALVDFIKVLRILPDNWGGRVAVLLNLVAFVVLYIVLGTSPVSVALPPEISSVVHSVTVYLTIITRVVGNLPPEMIPVLISLPVGVYHFVSQLAGSLLSHTVLKKFLTVDVSHTLRKIEAGVG
jgi:uncharacterized membrane protein